MTINEKQSSDMRFDEACRRNGWKRTSQRRAVFTYLCDNHEHPSVETVWTRVKNRLPDVSLDSVYRILDDFAAAGIVRRIGADKVIRYDCRTCGHGHFICGVCGRMYDFDHPQASMEVALAACREFGTPETLEVSVRGVCRACRDGRGASS